MGIPCAENYIFGTEYAICYVLFPGSLIYFGIVVLACIIYGIQDFFRKR